MLAKIMLGICGVYQELTGNIDKLLEFVPILHRYTNVVKSDYRSDDIFKVCKVYSSKLVHLLITDWVCRIW